MRITIHIQTTNKGGVLVEAVNPDKVVITRAVAPNLLTWQYVAMNINNGLAKLRDPITLDSQAVGEFKQSAKIYFTQFFETIAVMK